MEYQNDLYSLLTVFTSLSLLNSLPNSETSTYSEVQDTSTPAQAGWDRRVENEKRNGIQGARCPRADTTYFRARVTDTDK